jgi:uncharacterized protein (DUF58 family)
MPIPSRWLVGLAGLWLALAIMATGHEALRPLWQYAGMLLTAVALVDLWFSQRQGCPISAERECPSAWPVGIVQEVTVVLKRESFGERLSGRFFDHVPAVLWFDELPGRFNLHEPVARIRYRALATARGDYRFGALEVRLDSPLLLWSRAHRLGGDEEQRQPLRVYPDFARIARYTLLATDNRLSQIGLLLRRRRGEGLEFHQLREYRQGDALRQIDWKATARYRELISREYQDERNQQIIFLLDCSQRMNTREQADGPGIGTAGVPVPELSHFDHALNAMLLLSYVALRQGDGIGLSTFAHPKPRHIAVRRSMTALNHFMENVYDLEPSTLVPDYQEVVADFAQRVKKRSLVVILSNLRDEDSESLEAALARLSRQHLVVVASLREPGLSQALEARVKDFDRALMYAAASEYHLARQHTTMRLRSRGVACLEVTPERLPMTLVNHYWHIKRSGRL